MLLHFIKLIVYYIYFQTSLDTYRKVIYSYICYYYFLLLVKYLVLYQTLYYLNFFSYGVIKKIYLTTSKHK